MDQEKIKRVCNNCENRVYVSETTGECPYCNVNAVFTEPEPDNILSDDPETGFNNATESSATAD